MKSRVLGWVASLLYPCLVNLALQGGRIRVGLYVAVVTMMRGSPAPKHQTTLKAL